MFRLLSLESVLELQQASSEAEAGAQIWLGTFVGESKLVLSTHGVFSEILKDTRLDPVKIHMADQMLQARGQPSKLRIKWVPFMISKTSPEVGEMAQ